MNRFDATKPTIDARDESIADSMTRFRHAVGATSTRRPRCASNAARSGVALRHAPKRDDGQVLPAAAMLDDQLHDGTGSPSHERVWLRARRSARPSSVLDLHTDHLGTVRAVTAVTGAATTLHNYFPFGEEITSQSSFNTHQYTGHERDKETGLDYMLARYYGAAVGRFISVDPVSNDSGRRRHPDRFNLYVYAANNPLKFRDPNGEDPQDIFRLVYMAQNLDRNIKEAGRDLVAAGENLSTVQKGVLIGAGVLAVAEPSPTGEVLVTGLAVRMLAASQAVGHAAAISTTVGNAMEGDKTGVATSIVGAAIGAALPSTGDQMLDAAAEVITGEVVDAAGGRIADAGKESPATPPKATVAPLQPAEDKE